MSREKLALMLLVSAYVLLIPGILQPILILTGTIDKAELAALGKDVVVNNPNFNSMLGSMVSSLIDSLDIQGTQQVYEKARSILGTVKELWDSGNAGVGFLVVLFSVIIPVLKGSMILSATLAKQWVWRGQALKLANLVSKWSMADVFVVATIVAFLAANASKDAGEIVTLHARFGTGFYFFLAYCLLSIASAQIMPKAMDQSTD
ncbi:MAG: paraquat-inducible protein A [bacterium]